MRNRSDGDKQLYAALGVEQTATQEEIRLAYRQLSLQTHPDRNIDDAEAKGRFQAIQAAYEILSDVERRRRYDETGDERDRHDDDEDDAAAFMASFMGFASGTGFSSRRKQRGPDAIVDLDLTLEELYTGCTKTLDVERLARCPYCRGNGGKAGRRKVTCSSCGGDGMKYVSAELYMGVLHSRPIDCPSCRGSGERFRPSDRCAACSGNGVLPEKKRELQVKIEAGTSVDEVIELEGEADAAIDAPAGSLILRLHALDHPTFAFAPTGSADLISNITLTLSEAMLGFDRIVLLHLDGRGIRVTQPGPSTSGYRLFRNGDVVRIIGEGMPSIRRRGDLYLRISIEQDADGWVQSLGTEQLRTLASLLPPKRPDLPDPPSDITQALLEPASLPDQDSTRPHVTPEPSQTSSCIIS